MKKETGWNFNIWQVLLLLCVFFAPHAVFSQGKDQNYAVEVAALSSRDCADELVHGLVARGLDAYWLKFTQGKLGEFYRVRIGKFPDLDVARSFANNLLDSGLLDTCSITVYEAPLTSLMKSPAVAQNDRLPVGLRNSPIGAYCPIDLSFKNSNKPEAILSSLSSASSASSASSLSESRDVAPAAQRSGLSSSRDSSPDMDVNKKTIDAIIASTQASLGSIRPKVNMAISLTTIDSGINKAVNKIISEREKVASAKEANLGNRNAEPEIRLRREESATPSAPATPVAFSRNEKNPLVGNSRPGGGNPVLDAGTAPHLRGVIEMNNGQMFLKLTNLDQQRSFSGLARVTLSDDSDNNDDIAPLAIDLKPEEEKVVPISEVKQPYGDMMLMVYDQRQTVQLIRSIPYGQRPKTAIAANRSEDRSANASDGGGTPGAPDAWKITDSGGDRSPSVEVPAAGVPQQGLPNVTGSFDATQVPDPTANGVPNQNGDNNAASQTANGDNSQGIAISPRMVSSNANGVVMEIGLNGQQPIGYVKVSIRSGNFQDEKIAVFPTSNASVPFLIPLNDAKGGQFSYQVINDTGKVIGNGTQNFGPVGPDS
ncbi:MAG: SPOR domain-containing protein [Blastocatellia bacterium]|nr:SPOR domain-containing protein [Blastocatellia bacterium]